MTSYELHVFNTVRESETGRLAGLPELSPDGDHCQSCREEVGYGYREFYPVAVALDESKHWFLCMDCISPILGLAIQ